MCRGLFVLSIILYPFVLFGQPEKMSYQAVIRDALGKLVTSTTVSTRISILQGSVNGTAVYIENHSPITNTNGLATFEIGAGTTIDQFSSIDWSDGPYFIKTETDPSGGVNFSVVGTSQLLSVPYALHAKTADKLSGIVQESDPVFATSVASGISSQDTARWNNRKKYNIGDFAQGGVVFWVDETGEHGLVCAKEDQGERIKFYAGEYIATMARGDGLYAGEMNTMLIMAAQGMGDSSLYAARMCSELEVTEDSITYGDWYLPSLYELNLMYVVQDAIDSTALANGGKTFNKTTPPVTFYWSSTEEDYHDAHGQNFQDGLQVFGGKHDPPSVRAIRRF